MNSFTSFFSTNRPYDEVLPWLKGQLRRAGLRVLQTFDLRLTLPSVLEDCPCPHHGTEQCDCQMIVILVYGSEERPVSLILHGNDGQTWLSLIDQVGQRADAGTVNAIRQALESQALTGT